MNYKLFVIYDRKSGCFDSQIHSFVNSDVAIRWLYQLVHDFMDSETGRNSAIVSYPGDFELYCLGEYNSQSGCVIKADIPEFVISVADLKEVV